MPVRRFQIGKKWILQIEISREQALKVALLAAVGLSGSVFQPIIDLAALILGKQLRMDPDVGFGVNR